MCSVVTACNLVVTCTSVLIIHHQVNVLQITISQPLTVLFVLLSYSRICNAIEMGALMLTPTGHVEFFLGQSVGTRFSLCCAPSGRGGLGEMVGWTPRGGKVEVMIK